jgi:flagellar basal body-associated protein FliL
MQPAPLAHASGGEEKGKEGEEKKEEKSPPPPLHTLIPMEEFAIPIVDGGQIQGTLRFTLVLRATNDESVAKITEEMPALRAATLAAGMNFASLRASPYRPVNAEILAADIDAALKSIDPNVQQGLIVKISAVSEG